jgi:hypothetical protein
MSKFSTYDPEDIEKLMLNKSFHELYDKEKEFVLRHVDSEEEYEQMRQVLLDVKASEDFDEIVEPPAYMRKQLIEEFESQKRQNPLILLFQQVQAAFKMPVFQIGFATVSVFLFVVIFVKFNNKSDNIELAQNKNYSTETVDQSPEITEPSASNELEILEEMIVEESAEEDVVEDKSDDAFDIDDNEVVSLEEETVFFTVTKANQEIDVLDNVKSLKLKDETVDFSSTNNSTRTAYYDIGVQNEVVTVSTTENDKSTYKRNRNNNLFGGVTSESKVSAQSQATIEGSSIESNKDVFFGIMYAAM